MSKNRYIVLILLALSLFGVGCASKRDPAEEDPMPTSHQQGGASEEFGFPRLVINGRVSNAFGEALQGIYVSVFGVREPAEQDIITYNYAVTDTAGRYTIIRYRGREIPAEVTLVATDSTGHYQEQHLFAPVTYDSVYSSSDGTKIPYNGFVTADFVLTSE